MNFLIQNNWFIFIPFLTLLSWAMLLIVMSQLVMLKPLDFPWIRIFLKNCSICSLKCNVTPEIMLSVSETGPIQSAQYHCDLLDKTKCYSLVYVRCFMYTNMEQNKKEKMTGACRNLVKSRTLRTKKKSIICMPKYYTGVWLGKSVTIL